MSFSSLRNAVCSVQTDSGRIHRCEITDAASLVPQYSASTDKWVLNITAEASVAGPILFETNTKWVRLNIQTDGKSGYFQWDLPPQPVSTSTYTNSPVISDASPDFRNTRWGMTMNEVRAAESETSLIAPSDPNMLFGLVSVAGHNAGMIYEFGSNGLLQSAGYMFQIEHTNDNLYIYDYEDIKDLLSSKYGSPTIEGPVWKRDLYKDDPDRWGFAVSRGDVSFIAVWSTPTTDITLLLYGDNYEITLGLTYSSRSVTPAKSTQGL